MNRDEENMEKLIDAARALGATAAAFVGAADIVIDDKLADICRDPGCPDYGQSPSCPPHHGGPDGLREILKKHRRALAFKIELPPDAMSGADLREIFYLLHLIASGVERAAAQIGYTRARGFAGGSCKRIFCEDKPDCRALQEGGQCRNPDQARPSMSGFGINVFELTRAAGWTGDGDSEKNPMAALGGKFTGLVLID